MARKVELGAGIAGGVLGIITLFVLLFAPLVSYCSVQLAPSQSCPALRYESLVSTGLDAAGWIFLLGMIAVILIASAGAIADAYFHKRIGVVPLWVATAVAFSGCSIAAQSAGLFFLPSIIAVCLAAYAALLQRIKERRVAASAAPPADSVR